MFREARCQARRVRHAELNQCAGLDPFRQSQQNTVDHVDEQFPALAAATSEQLHHAGENACATVRWVGCDHLFQFSKNISRRICHHGRGLT